MDTARPSAPSYPLQAWLTLGALALVWGSSYILIKKSLIDFSPVQVGQLRLIVAGLSFAPVAIARCRGLRVKTWLWLLLVGLCGTGLPSFLFPYAQQEISSSLAAALSSLTPLLTLLIAISFFGGKMRSSQTRGILLGLAGALLLVGARYGWSSIIDGNAPLLFIAAAVTATLCYALSSNVVKAKFATTDPVLVTAGAFVPLGVGSAISLLFSVDLPTGFGESDTLLLSYLFVAFLGLVGTALASWLFFRLVQLTEPVFASTVSYLVPIIAFGWGIYDGEIVTFYTLLALVVILLGVYLSRK